MLSNLATCDHFCCFWYNDQGFVPTEIWSYIKLYQLYLTHIRKYAFNLDWDKTERGEKMLA